MVGEARGMIDQWRGGVRGKGRIGYERVGRRGKESGAEGCGVERRDAMVV